MLSVLHRLLKHWTGDKPLDNLVHILHRVTSSMIKTMACLCWQLFVELNTSLNLFDSGLVDLLGTFLLYRPLIYTVRGAKTRACLQFFIVQSVICRSAANLTRQPGEHQNLEFGAGIQRENGKEADASTYNVISLLEGCSFFPFDLV